MEKYLDKEEMEVLVKEADPKLRRNYNLFALNPKEKTERDYNRTKRRNFLNPKDPYLNPLVFVKQH